MAADVRQEKGEAGRKVEWLAISWEKCRAIPAYSRRKSCERKQVFFSLSHVLFVILVEHLRKCRRSCVLILRCALQFLVFLFKEQEVCQSCAEAVVIFAESHCNRQNSEFVVVSQIWLMFIIFPVVLLLQTLEVQYKHIHSTCQEGPVITIIKAIRNIVNQGISSEAPWWHVFYNAARTQELGTYSHSVVVIYQGQTNNRSGIEL